MSMHRRHQRLASRIGGTIVEPGEPGYEEARRIWNARFDSHPAAIVFVGGTDDVAAALDYATERGLAVAVRAGGHGPAGASSAEGGLVINLRRLNAATVTGDGYISVGGGTIVRQLNRFLGTHNLVLPFGTCSGVGVAGLALGGGLGHLNGSLGLTCDALRSARIVLADGSCLVASKASEPNLFWALQGAGANFGVVTRLTFKTSPALAGYGGGIAFRDFDLAGLITLFRDLCVNSADALGLELRLQQSAGGTIAIVLAFWHGDLRDGEIALAPFHRLGEPAAGGFSPMRYSEMIEIDEAPEPHRSKYVRTIALDVLDDQDIRTITELHKGKGGQNTMTLIHWRHGMTTRVPVDQTAFAHRCTAFEISLIAAGPPGSVDGAHKRRIDTTWMELGGPSRPAYANMLDRAPASFMASVYGAHYKRLAHLKARFDPANRFHGNANIEPEHP